MCVQLNLCVSDTTISGSGYCLANLTIRGTRCPVGNLPSCAADHTFQRRRIPVSAGSTSTPVKSGTRNNPWVVSEL